MKPDEASPIGRVKRSTTDEHESVEAVLTARFLERSEFDRNDFGMLLARYYGLYTPLDDVLEPLAEGQLQNFQYQNRGSCIAEDLRALGFKERQIESLPTLERDSIAIPATLPALLGTLYVVEGASLGNHVIRRKLEPQLDGVFSRADAFFHDDGAATGERWKRFRTVFNRRIESDVALAVAIRAARETFTMYEEWFS